MIRPLHGGGAVFEVMPRRSMRKGDRFGQERTGGHGGGVPDECEASIG